jgi:hypothetical protein
LACQNKFFDVKENDEHALDSANHYSIGRILLCFRVIIINPALVTNDNPGQEGCMVRGNLTKLLTDDDMLLLLMSCQKSGQVHDSK